MPYFKPNHDDTEYATRFGREILFEITYVGNLVRVTAIDAETGIEATITGAPTMTQYTLRMNAVRKLARLMRQESHEDDHAQKAETPKRRGRYA